jgi:hypothetical protein
MTIALIDILPYAYRILATLWLTTMICVVLGSIMFELFDLRFTPKAYLSVLAASWAIAVSIILIWSGVFVA